LAVAGCGDKVQMFQGNNEGGWFSKPVDVFAKPEWAKPTGDSKAADLGPKGPVGPDDLVGADGRCGIAAPETAQASAPPAAAEAQPPADRPVGSVAGDLAGAPMPAATTASANPNAGMPAAAEPGAPQVMGGIALGMTECQAVQRAGLPGNVNIGTGDKGERKVVLTYLTGTWPGIYRFADGRLKEIERAPAPPAPPKAPPKKKIAKKPVKKPQT
jgi:hypothetical protein